ncbi:MAG: DUF134 domain-containing protein [Gemmatimonadota bacterium]
MSRPPLPRTICGRPRASRYKPSGIPARFLAEVTLGLDEMEALRLADLEGLYQEAAAGRMGISRPTFGRLVAAARRKVADALFHGKSLAFEGGPVAVGPGPWWRCGRCGQQWQAVPPAASPNQAESAVCIACGSDQVATEAGAGATGAVGTAGHPGRGRGGGPGGGGGQGRGRGAGCGRRGAGWSAGSPRPE